MWLGVVGIARGLTTLRYLAMMGINRDMARTIALTFVLLGAGVDRAIALCVDLLCETEAQHCCCPEEGSPREDCCFTGQSNENAFVVEASRPRTPRIIEAPALTPEMGFHVDAIRSAPSPSLEDIVVPRPLALRI